MVRFLCIAVLLSLASGATAQTIPIDWHVLATVEYKVSDKERAKMIFQKPNFSDTLQVLEGQRVRLSGYMLPLTVDQPLYILSRYSFTECFFCNPKSGKETVVELHLRKEGKRFQLDEPMTWEGTLSLSKDPYGLSFILEDAVPVK